MEGNNSNNNNNSILNLMMIDNNTDNNNNNIDKDSLDAKKRKLTLNLNSPQLSDETTPITTLNTPQLTLTLSNINNKRIKQTPNALPLQTPTTTLINAIETPSFTDTLPTPVMTKLLNDFVNGVPTGLTPNQPTLVAFPIQQQHQHQQQTQQHIQQHINQQQQQTFLSTPKNETEIAICFQQALEDVKRKNANNNNNNNIVNNNQITIQTQQNFTISNYNNNSSNINNNSNTSYTTLTPVPTTNLFMNQIDKSGQQQQQQQQHNILVLSQPQQQPQQQQAINNINTTTTTLLVKEEPQTVPVHNEITIVNAQPTTSTNNNNTKNKPTKTSPAKRTRKISTQLTNNNKSISSSISSNSSSPTRTPTPQIGQDGQISIAPINLEEQEAIKIEKKRERNREAARKCRTRKLEKIATLEQQVKELNAKNTRITDESNVLREEINALKLKLQQHRQQHGCEVTLV